MNPLSEDASSESPDATSKLSRSDSLACGRPVNEIGIRCAKDELLNLRPAQELKGPDQGLKVTIAAKVAEDEADSTPRDHVKAKDPDPLDEHDSQEDEANFDLLDQLPEKKKKKKKKSSGKNRKIAPTGFEGSFCSFIILFMY
jgi:hypothetical protein